MDEGKLRIQMDRGQRAKALLDNELLTGAFESIETSLHYAWKTSRAGDELAREDIWRSTQLLTNLKECLTRHVTTGEAAGKELLRIEKESKLRKIFNG